MKFEPLVSLHVRFLIPEKSADVTLKVTGILSLFSDVFIDIDVGQVIFGGVVSVILIENVQFDVRFALSVAVQKTVVEPRGKLAPDVALHDDEDIPEPSVAENPVVLNTMGIVSTRLAVGLEMLGQVHTGGVVSVTLTGKIH